MENSKTLSDINFISVEIVYKGNVLSELTGNLDIGGISLEKEDRTYHQDVTDTFWKYREDSDTTLIEGTLMEDEKDLKDIFDSKFDITEKDLLSLDLAEIYLGGEHEEGIEPYNISLFYQKGEEEYSIDLDIEK